ncbi:uncharacterized protein PRCAT00005801001 [Priceomyces carsonii]|uniref:uncharacterized protein n=1 Tax=Priceomyces carsonii TaxID=28549 RepID=UPI002EDA95BF|nr:unnamed protein product [Priceomyces carsonii]
MVDGRKQRPSRACTFCKKRKIKCDLRTPCSSCIRYGCLECRYTQPANIGDISKLPIKAVDDDRRTRIEDEVSTLDERVKELKKWLAKDVRTAVLEELTDTSHFEVDHKFLKRIDKVNFHDRFFSTELEDLQITTKGPLSWFSLIKIDMSLSQLHLKCIKLIRETFDRLGTELETQVRANKSRSLDSSRIFSVTPTDYNSLGVGELGNYHAQFLGNITDLPLPNMKVINLLVDRFFSHIHCLCNFFNEKDFRNKLSGLLDFKDAGGVESVSIKISDNKDFANLGSLLLALRLGYLSLFTCTGEINNSRQNNNNVAFLIGQPISSDLVQISEDFLNYLKERNEYSIEMYQLALMHLYYLQVAPERGDSIDKGRSLVLVSFLFEMAYSLGFERDPNSIPGSTMDNSEAELRRWLWFYLLLIDSRRSMVTGAPLNFNRFGFDTKVPDLSIVGGGSTGSTGAPLSCYTFFKFSVEILESIQKVGGCNVNDLMTLLTPRENKWDYSKVRKQVFDVNFLSKPFSRPLALKAYLYDSTFVLSLLFHLYIFYERKRDASQGRHLLRKLLKVISDILGCVCEFLGNMHNILGDCSDLVVGPPLEILLHKSILILLAINNRVNFALIDSGARSKNAEDPHFTYTVSTLKRAKNILDQFIHLSSAIISHLGKRYNYANFIAQSLEIFKSSTSLDQLYLLLSVEERLFLLDLDMDFISTLCCDLEIAFKMMSENFSFDCISFQTAPNLEREDNLKETSPVEKDGAFDFFTEENMMNFWRSQFSDNLSPRGDLF